MKTLLYTVCTVALLGSALPVAAADNVVMVELFTSQGCSSCPPADKNLGALTGHDDVLPLSMHVDYWDYLGWRDTFASPDYTARQINYRDAMGARVIYTPQMVVQGRHDVPGYRPDMIQSAIADSTGLEPHASVKIKKQDGMLAAHIEPMNGARPCTIWMASYEKSATVEIKRGENAGETITYHNVVEKLMRVGTWSGDADRTIDLPQPGNGEGVAIWLQDDRTGHIYAASYIEG